VLFISLNTLLYLATRGLAYHYLWPGWVSTEAVIVTELMFISNIFDLLRIRPFPALHKQIPIIENLFKSFIVLNIFPLLI